jgi:hypothetical protein
MRWEHFARHTAILYPFADRPPTILGHGVCGASNIQ